MKNVRFLALAMVVALSLMGAGYAYWTDTLTINNAVSTGEFDVTFAPFGTDEAPEISGLERNTPGYNEGEHEEGDTWYASDYVNNLSVVLAAGDKQLDVTVGNLYPGSKGKLETAVVNNGTIPVVFDYAEVIYDDASAAILNEVLFSMGKYEDEDEFGRHDKVKALTLDGLKAGIEGLLAGERLEPNSTDSIMPLSLNVVLPASAKESAENLTGSFTVKLHWKQHNAPSTQQ